MKRQITIYESAQNGKITVFNDVDVNTLGELKALLVEKGVNITDMEFIEGVTNTKLLNDDSRLPENIPFKDKRTNNLFINILRKESKIKSGISFFEMDRPELLNAARPYKDEILERFGKNFTQVKSYDLASFLEEMEGEYEEKGGACEEEACKEGPVVDAIVAMIKALGCEDEVVKALSEGSFFTSEDIKGFIRK